MEREPGPVTGTVNGMVVATVNGFGALSPRTNGTGVCVTTADRGPYQRISPERSVSSIQYQETPSGALRSTTWYACSPELRNGEIGMAWSRSGEAPRRTRNPR